MELPLSLCYRCPKTHIKLVNHIFENIPIEARENAPTGIIEQLREEDLWSSGQRFSLRIGDLVLSRKTAPLVTMCLKLIARGIKATVRGKEIGIQIKAELYAIGQLDGFEYEQFISYSNNYKKFKFALYKQMENGRELKEILADKLEALTTIYESQANAQNLQHLANYIDSLFSDYSSPITLSTCHRAKGLENERIFLLRPESMPQTWEQQKSWQKEQEDNLLYVALTRSKSELYIVGKAHWLSSSYLSSSSEKSPQINQTTSKTQKPIEKIWQLIPLLSYEEKQVLINRLQEQLSPLNSGLLNPQQSNSTTTEEIQRIKIDPNSQNLARNQTGRYEHPQAYKVFSSPEPTPEKRDHSLLKEKLANLLQKIPKTNQSNQLISPIIDQQIEELNLWLEDPILRETAIRKVINTDGLDFEYDSAQIPIRVIRS